MQHLKEKLQNLTTSDKAKSMKEKTMLPKTVPAEEEDEDVVEVEAEEDVAVGVEEEWEAPKKDNMTKKMRAEGGSDTVEGGETVEASTPVKAPFHPA